MSVLPSNQFGLWVGAQPAKGADATARKQLRVISGQMAVTKEQGRENYGDGRRFSTSSDYLTQVMGSGEITVQGTPGDYAYLLWLMLGDEQYAPASEETGDPAQHTITANDNGGHWFTVWQSIGEGDTKVQQVFKDCKISQITCEASTGTPTLHLTLSIVSIDPGHVADAMPTVAQSPVDPMLFHEATGQLVIDGDAYGEISQLQWELNDQLTPLFGDDVKAFDMAAGRSEGTVTWTMTVTSETLKLWNKAVYGTETPAVGQTPSADVFYGSLTAVIQRGALTPERQGVSAFFPTVAFQPAPAIEFSADGGAVELSMSGEIRGQDFSFGSACYGDPTDADAYAE